MKKDKVTSRSKKNTQKPVPSTAITNQSEHWYEKYRVQVEFWANVITISTAIIGGLFFLIDSFRKLSTGVSGITSYLFGLGGAIAILAALSWVGFAPAAKEIDPKISGKNTQNHKKKTTHLFPALYKWARVALGIFVVTILISVFILNQQQIALKEKIVILIVRLDGPEKDYGITDELYDKLKTTMSKFEDVAVIPYKDLEESITGVQGSDYARKIGEENNADIVIWGWYKPTDIVNIKIYVENLSPYELPVLNPKNKLEPKATLTDLKTLTLHYTLDSEMTALVFFLSGMARYDIGDFSGALERFEGAMSQPVWASDLINHSRALYFTGTTAALLKQKEKAISFFTQAINIDPSFTQAYAQRAYFYDELGRLDLSVADYTKALELEPNNDVYLNNRGVVYQDLGKIDEALKDYSTAIDINPNQLTRYYNRGLLYYSDGKYTEAIQDFLVLTKAKSNDVDQLYLKSAYFYLASSYFVLEQTQLALDNFSRAIELDDTFYSAYSGRCAAYCQAKSYNESIKDCQVAIKLTTGDDDQYDDYPYYYEGLDYLALHETEKAINDFQNCLIVSKATTFQNYCQEELNMLTINTPSSMK